MYKYVLLGQEFSTNMLKKKKKKKTSWFFPSFLLWRTQNILEGGKAFKIPARQIWRQDSYFAKKSNLYLPPELNSLRNTLPIATIQILGAENIHQHKQGMVTSLNKVRATFVAFVSMQGSIQSRVWPHLVCERPIPTEISLSFSFFSFQTIPFSIFPCSQITHFSNRWRKRKQSQIILLFQDV